MGLFPKNKELIQSYESLGLKPRFQYFNSWRQYEYIHMFFWLGIDYTWESVLAGHRWMIYVWILFSVPTVLGSLDFIFVTYKSKVRLKILLYIVHNVSTLLVEYDRFGPLHCSIPLDKWSVRFENLFAVVHQQLCN